MSSELTPSTLQRLTTEALISFLGHARDFEASLGPGCAAVLSNEPVADLNYVVVGDGGERGHRFRRAAASCIDRGLPFLAIVFPTAPSTISEEAEELGLMLATQFPFMVHEGPPVQVQGPTDVVVGAARPDEAAEWGAVLAAAFEIPDPLVARALPSTIAETPGVELVIARREGRAVGMVVLTHHGETAGIWAMGTTPSEQGRGVGKRLLSTAMASACERGVRRFFLGATAAGFPLYERLGFETRSVTSVWASGETGQA